MRVTHGRTDRRTDGPDYHSQDRVSIAGGLVFWATVCKTVRPMLSVRSLYVLSVTLVYCGQTVGRIKMKLSVQYGGRPMSIVATVAHLSYC